MTGSTLTLRNFLKRYSPVPNSFIDDLFYLYGESTSQTDFVVDLDAVARWLSVRKGVIVETLTSSYRKNIDYIVRTPITRPTGRGGHNKKLILLTPDCFKRMCMRSRGKKAEDVRTYFIQLEGMVLRYKDQMMAGMRAEIEALERNQKGRRGRGGEVKVGGYIYVLRASERHADLLKIGRARDLHRRLREHEASRADDIEVLYVLRTEDVDAVESCIKGTLLKHRYRSHREVYRVDLDSLKQVVHGCDALQGLLKLEHASPGRQKTKTNTGGSSSSSSSSSSGGSSCFMCIIRDGSD